MVAITSSLTIALCLLKAVQAIHDRQLRRRQRRGSSKNGGDGGGIRGGGQGCEEDYQFRTFDGRCNNLRNPLLGASEIPFLRFSAPAYGDGISTLSGADRPNPRTISNTICAQDGSILNSASASDYIWQWGQFLDHDITLVPESEAAGLAPIRVPQPDPDLPVLVIPFVRSINIGGSSEKDPRQQLNFLTAFIDASNVYGSNIERSNLLRDIEKREKLATSAGNLLPLDENGVFFIAGDIRAAEQVGLTAMHTLFMREHNRIVAEIKKDFSGNDERIFQIARKAVGVLMQVITYNEFLPTLLGLDALPPYSGYDTSSNPGIGNEFSTAIFRYGHTQLSPTLRLQDERTGSVTGLPLRDAFLLPHTEFPRLENILLGLSQQVAQEFDTKIVDDVRSFLFRNTNIPDVAGFDLPSLNLQRGRDHGLPDYNTIRAAYNLSRRKSYNEITSDPVVAAQFEQTYGPDGIDKLDLWVAALAEDQIPGALVGETVRTIMIEQFQRLRNGDRFWYQNDPFFRSSPSAIQLLQKLTRTTLKDIIVRNTNIGADQIQDNVFRVVSPATNARRQLQEPITKYDAYCLHTITSALLLIIGLVIALVALVIRVLPVK